MAVKPRIQRYLQYNQDVRSRSFKVTDVKSRILLLIDSNGHLISSSSSPSLYSPKENSVPQQNSELDSRAGQHGSKKATLIVAREERIKYTQNYTKLDKTIELTLDITKI